MTSEKNNPPENPEFSKVLRVKIEAELSKIYDPEIPINIYDLGLIYSIDMDDKGIVNISMTFTSPGCPVAGQLLDEVNVRMLGMEEVSDVVVDITFDPPWSKEMASKSAQMELELLFGI